MIPELTANTTETSPAKEEEVVSPPAELVNNSNDEGGESGINISNNNDNTKTKQQPSSRPKSHISFDGELLYMHYYPRKNSDYIHCTCKNHKCGGSFRLFRWLFNSKHDGNTLDTI